MDESKRCIIRSGRVLVHVLCHHMAGAACVCWEWEQQAFGYAWVKYLLKLQGDFEPHICARRWHAVNEHWELLNLDVYMCEYRVCVFYLLTAERAQSCALLFCGNLYRNHVPAGSVRVLGITSAEYMCCKWNFLVLQLASREGLSLLWSREDRGNVCGSRPAEGKARRLGAVL